MKKILLGSLLLLSSFAYSQDKFLSFPNGYVEATKFKVHKSITEGTSYIDVTYTFDGAYIDNYKEESKTYQKIYMPEGKLLTTKGAPELPYYSDVLAIGSNKGVKITVKSSKYKEYNSFNVRPSVGITIPGSEIKRAEESEVYTENKLYPTSIANLLEVETRRNVPIATVRLYPVRYNPVSKKLRCYTSITYRIEYTNSNTTSTLSNTMSDVVKGMVINPTSIDKYNASGLKSATATTPESYVIVTTNKYKSIVERFIKWKSMQGYKCKLICKSSYTVSSLKSLLKTEYNTKVPEYLVIFGDNEDVPGIQFSISHNREDIPNPVVMYTDNLYANSTYIKGNMSVTSITPSSADNYNFVPDIITGRISVSNTTEANNVVDKIINYEKNPPVSENFYNKAVHSAFFQNKPYYNPNDGKWHIDGFEDVNFTWSSEATYNTVTGNSDIQIERIYTVEHDLILPMNSFLPLEYRNSWDHWNYSSGAQSKMINAINNNVNYVLYSGHGNPDGWGNSGFTNNSIAQLNNGDKLPFFFGGIACQTGMYENASCFAETALRKSNGGAIGITANSQYGWLPLCTNNSVELFSNIFIDKETNVAKSMHSTWFNNLEDEEEYPYKAHICLSAHYFGDPSLCIYTQEPICFTPTITKNGTTVKVNTNGVSNCKITLTSLLNPSDASRMKVMLGDNVSFTGINYPYVITIQKNNYATYIGSSDVYIQNYTFSNNLDVYGNSIYAGSDVSTSPTMGSSTSGPVLVNAGPVYFKASNRISMKSGFSVKNGVRFGAYIEECMHGGTEYNSSLKSSNSVITEYKRMYDSQNELLQEEESAFALSPNPTSGRFTIDLGEQSGSVRVYDTQGREQRAYSAVEGMVECDLTDMPAGIYIVEIKTVDYTINKKVIKQ